MTDAQTALAQVRAVLAAGISTDDDSPVTVAKWVKSVGPVNVAAILAHVDAQAAEIERLTKSEPTEAQIEARDALLDFISENGTASEGVQHYLDRYVRAALAAKDAT